MPGCIISFISSFSLLQSRIVPVWDWLSQGVFEHRKSSQVNFKFGSEAANEGRSSDLPSSTAEDPGEDLHWRRATAGSTHRRKRTQERTCIGKGPAARSTHRRRRTQERTFIGHRPAAGSTTSIEEIKERTFIGGESRRASTLAHPGHPLRHHYRKDLKYRQNQAIYFSLTK